MKALLIGLAIGLAVHSAEARGGGGGRGGAPGIAVATAPFRTTIAIARQAATISRLRAQQAVANHVTASGGLAGFGFAGGERRGGFGFVGGGGRSIENASAERAARVPRMRVITVAPSEVAAGQIQIIRGTSVETVQVP
jgi:hypothetical protein